MNIAEKLEFILFLMKCLSLKADVTVETSLYAFVTQAVDGDKRSVYASTTAIQTEWQIIKLLMYSYYANIPICDKVQLFHSTPMKLSEQCTQPKQKVGANSLHSCRAHKPTKDRYTPVRPKSTIHLSSAALDS